MKGEPQEKSDDTHVPFILAIGYHHFTGPPLGTFSEFYIKVCRVYILSILSKVYKPEFIPFFFSLRPSKKYFIN